MSACPADRPVRCERSRHFHARLDILPPPKEGGIPSKEKRDFLATPSARRPLGPVRRPFGQFVAACWNAA